MLAAPRLLVAGLLATLSAHGAAGALMPRQSAAPTCTYACADADGGGYALNPAYTTDTGGTLHCEYPSATDQQGEYYCDYDDQTGQVTLSMDDDPQQNSFCPAAVQSCGSQRRYVHEDNLVAVLRKRAERGSTLGKVARAPIVLNRLR